MGRLGVIIAALSILVAAGEAAAQCTREGEELCQNGQTYRCEKTGSELTAIFQNLPCAVNAPAQALTGSWVGSGHQSPAGDAGADWTIAMTIRDDGASIDYPSLGCGGSLSQTSRDDASAEFHESITYGQDKCIDGGDIAVRFFKGKLSWTWVGQADGQPYNAVAVLTRQ
ncbi:hypothetical protein EN829_013870 [Mesorhizobium sp. M00.F.Ca.ET.186.01.1.1]|nr:hypothetical protein EN848_15555 [bacterium M00.F.Ca.ET.205.01.1.1]TGU52781.1 hypothetical protein EN795_13840 [bacterium M00.F.Ca.ET.152.01.1.1]TGV35755.1 hypothetical protein EN829_013870 [Mesorhizobium sp. M00.F.Ca.ET.186.01.1.1]TGZ43333.1 hypothetical protein EN805_09450 [bacterium M00.F.Ca.ET.162.01.1.1]TIW62121.1 MAG: hypothetical protein E5V48_06130 [Mesorhizobium sp.]